MSQNSWCKMCEKYHFNGDSYYDKDLNETILFCSPKCKGEYITKKSNPNYKTKLDISNEAVRSKQAEYLADKKAKRDAVFDSIYAKKDNVTPNPSGDYTEYEKKSKNTGGFFSDLMKEDPRAAAKKQREIDEENAKINAWLRKYWRFWVPGLIAIIIFLYFFVKSDSNKMIETSNEMELRLMDSINKENEKMILESENEKEKTKNEAENETKKNRTEAEKAIEKTKNTADEDLNINESEIVEEE